jgi:type IV pilus assembly protein PilM
MPSLPKSKLNPSLSVAKLPRPSLKLGIGRRSGRRVAGLDIQPGHVVAVQARVNGRVVVEQAAALPLPADAVREGEVLDEDALAETLRELFRDGRLGKEVRVGVANQRTVLRTLELPPVGDGKELDAAVRFQAQEQVPMPLNNAVLDFHALGVHDTPEGPRQQVVLVAAQRDMVSRLLSAVRGAGLRPQGIDLSAFALIRSLYRPDREPRGRVLYLNVDGLTNMAIAEGALCRFTRVVGGGLEPMASQLAERLGMPVADARALIAAADLSVPERVNASPSGNAAAALQGDEQLTPGAGAELAREAGEQDVSEAAEQAAHEGVEDAEEAAPVPGGLEEVRTVLENGLREIAGEVRNSLDFHRSQEGGGEVSLVVLSGAALDIPGFADALGAELGVPVTRETVAVVDASSSGAFVSPQRLAVAAGLSVEEAQTS